MSIAEKIQSLTAARTAIQNAITAKGGAITAADGFEDFATAIAAIPSSGGGSGLKKTLVATTAEEMTLKDFLTANPVPLKYRSGVVLLIAEASTAPTQGSGTINFCMFFYSYNNSEYTKYGMAINYKASLDVPNDMRINTMTANNAGYFTISNDSITSSNSTNSTRYFPVGTVFSKIDIPFDLRTRTIDETEVQR